VQVVHCVVLYCNTYRNTTCKTPDQTPLGTPIITIDAFRAFILGRLLVKQSKREITVDLGLQLDLNVEVEF